MLCAVKAGRPGWRGAAMRCDARQGVVDDRGMDGVEVGGLLGRLTES